MTQTRSRYEQVRVRAGPSLRALRKVPLLSVCDAFYRRDLTEEEFQREPHRTR
jgi:hypothetical protein